MSVGVCLEAEAEKMPRCYIFQLHCNERSMIKDLLDRNAWVIVGWFGFQLSLRYLCTGALTSRQVLDRFYRYAYGQQTWKKNDTQEQFVN